MQMIELRKLKEKFFDWCVLEYCSKATLLLNYVHASAWLQLACEIMSSNLFAPSKFWLMNHHFYLQVLSQSICC